MTSNRWRFAWAWFLGVVLASGLASITACGLNPPPKPPEKKCPESCPLGSECKDAQQGCQPIPAPGPECAVGQSYGCWHWPPDSRTWLYACPVYGNGGVVGIINVVGGPAQCPGTPTPTCPTCPAGQVCTDPAIGCVPSTPPPSGGGCTLAGEPTQQSSQPNTIGGEVNAAMKRLMPACDIGGTCLINGYTSQSWMAAVNAELRKAGICAGQHSPGVTDEIAVAQKASDPWQGFHVFAGDDSSIVPAPAGTRRTVVWSPNSFRGSWVPPSGGVVTPPPVTPPTASCPYAPCPTRLWTKETLPPGWGDDQIGKPAYQYNAHPHTMGNIDTTPVVVRQLSFCQSIGLGEMGGAPRASCPVRPDEHPERVAVENWLLFGGPVRDSRNGQDCTPNNTDNTAAFLGGTNNCRMCNVPKTVCTDWY